MGGIGAGWRTLAAASVGAVVVGCGTSDPPSDCRMLSSACAPGFRCVEASGAWSCVPIPDADGIGDAGFDGGSTDAALSDAEQPSDSGPPIDAGPACGTFRVRFTPTARASIALFVESEDGTRFETLGLTSAVAYRGIGNRPGASQMNSGFRWPYGRREGVLPYWAHRRVALGGAHFPRVIVQNRASEGFAAGTGDDSSRDDFFCLSFIASTTRRDALDAVSCASMFNSDKGRYITEEDVAADYAEPFETDAWTGSTRDLDLWSLYPPRRDVTRCPPGSVGCSDHADVDLFARDALMAMPELDAVTMATPTADVEASIEFSIPEAWPDPAGSLYLEVHTEGDYNEHYNDTTHPTPGLPDGLWDYWAETYGYPYRGQPSVVYEVVLPTHSRRPATTSEPVGYTDVHGLDEALTPYGDGRITDDPTAAPGSGADRLRRGRDGARLVVESTCEP